MANPVSLSYLPRSLNYDQYEGLVRTVISKNPEAIKYADMNKHDLKFLSLVLKDNPHLINELRETTINDESYIELCDFIMKIYPDLYEWNIFQDDIVRVSLSKNS